MDLRKALYLSVFSLYVAFFCLFLRFYIWKRYSERKFWSQRPVISPESVSEVAANLERALPFISILVPARNEADVIENTVRHLQGLRYPKDSFEIVVITDEKELLATRELRKSLISEAKRILGTVESVGDGVPLSRLESTELRDVLARVEAEFDSRKALAEAVRKGKGKDLPAVDSLLEKALAELHPTTQEVLEKLVEEARHGDGPTLKHVVVPYDFDGEFGGRLTGHAVQSTKGRALNWGLRYLDPKCQICGFYDAESRPHQDVLLYVSYRSLIDPLGSRVLQGPVFQIRNFYKMTPFCRIASLYQTVAHEWYLPWLFRVLPFVGGTNLFVQRRLLERVRGWDHSILTEDLEFGVRTYLQEGAWPSYLPYHSTEQTPPTFKGFFRQRLRWATGHLQVVDKVRDLRFVAESKQDEMLYRLSLKGQVEWVVYQLATFVPLITMILNYNHMLDETAVPPVGRWMLVVFSLVYVSFTFYIFLRYKHFFEKSFRPRGVLKNALVVLGLFILPLAAFLFPLPYTWALVLKSFGRQPTVWVKTPRTKERTV